MNTEEWNKGYEKGRDDYCCNGDCNQGRDCPLRKIKLTNEDAEQALKEWEKTETFPVGNVEAHGFINGFKWAIRKANEK